MRFLEEAGTKYRFKLISRKLDSLTKVEFIPEGRDDKEPIGKRESDIKFEREGDYFSYVFNYTRAIETNEVKIVFDGIDYEDLDLKDFVIFVFRAY